MAAGQCGTQTKEEKIIYLSLYTGVSCDKMIASGNIEYLHFNRPVKPTLAGVIDFDIPKAVILRLEVGYKPFSFDANGPSGKSHYYSYSLCGHSFTKGLAILYRIPLPFSLRPYVGIGIHANAVTVKENILLGEFEKENYLNISDDGNVISYRFGLMFGMRYALNVKVYKARLSNYNEPNRYLGNKVIETSFAYRF